MSVRRTFGIGTLLVTGDRFDFSAAPSLLFDARVGDEAEIGLTWRFAEASTLKEQAVLRLTVDLGGVKRTAETVVKDTPAFRNDPRGFLRHVASFPEKGPVVGDFVVEATYSAKSWLGGATSTTSEFREAGRVVVNVR